MRVVHLTSAHKVKDVRIYHKECRSLVQAGHDVHLVVSTSEHAEGEVTEEGICIHPVPEPSGRRERFLQTPLHVFQVARRLDADVYHFHDPELLPCGVALRLMGRTVVYDVHEHLAGSLRARSWIPEAWRPVVSRVAGAGEQLMARAMSGIIAVTPVIRRQFASLAIPSTVVHNYPLLREVGMDDEGRPYQDRPYNAIFVGGITGPRGIREMVRAQGRTAQVHPQAQLSLAGAFTPESLQQDVAKIDGWETTDFHGWISRSEMADLFGQARVGLVPFLPVPNHVEALPNKLFEYMSAGLPVVASDFPLWRTIVDDANCGILVDPEDPAAIADAVQWIYDHPDEAEAMGRRGREAVLNTYNWSNEEQTLLSFYNTLSE